MRMNVFLPFVLLLASVPPVSAQVIRINIGTVVPEGSVWYEGIERIRQEWRRVSDGRVDVRIFGGGKLGDDTEMLRKMRIGQLQAVALTGVGISRIDKGVESLQAPLMFESYDEVDYVLDRIRPELEKRLEKEGYVALNWVEGGWVHFFSKEPIRTPSDLRQQKLWITAGDPDIAKLYDQFGIQTTPLLMTDMLTSLQTGLITAIQVPPLFALADGSYKRAPHMTDLKWALVMGGTLISKKTWDRVPENLRREMAATAKTAGEYIRGRIRRMGDDAVDQMKARGLDAVQLTPDEVKLWRAEATKAYPDLRGTLTPAELFDETQRLRDEFRRKQSGK